VRLQLFLNLAVQALAVQRIGNARPQGHVRPPEELD
jgi:hypothetical protein